MLPIIQSLAEYSDTPTLRAFLNQVFDAHPVINRWQTDPARRVVIKPNWVQEAHEYRPEVWEPVITHPALLAALLDTTAERMGGEGTISLCDAPHTYANFTAILAQVACRLSWTGFAFAGPGYGWNYSICAGKSGSAARWKSPGAYRSNGFTDPASRMRGFDSVIEAR